MRKIAADTEQAEFLLSLIRLPEGSRASPAISDWDSVCRIAQEHGVLPLISRRLADWAGAMPEDQACRIREEAWRNTARNGALAFELLRIIPAFTSAGIPALPFKGVVLATQLDGDLAHRPAGDIDILIHFADRHRAAEVMKEAGYILEPGDSDAVEVQFKRESDGMIVELCWSLSPSWFRRELGLDAVWPHRCSCVLLGTAIPTFGPEHTLILLCLHGTKHEWMRLFWIRDVIQFLHVHPDLDWDFVQREARRLGLWRSVGLGVLLSHRLGGVGVADVVLRRFEADTRVRRLEEHVRRHLFDARYRQLDSLPNHYSVLDFRDRMRSLLKAGFAAPGSRDCAAIPLPGALGFLYYLVRPLRLMWACFIANRDNGDDREPSRQPGQDR